jgi:lipopolysaccharide export LptBFGC system permease protein LptF
MKDQELLGAMFFFIVSIIMLIYFYKRDRKRDNESVESVFGMMYRVKPYGLFIVIALVSLFGIIVKIIKMIK